MKPLYAVVSLLGAPHYGHVEQLWTELKERCGVAGIYETPFPHVSYHVAAGYDLPKLTGVLRRFAGRFAPFRIRTTGLGIFSGPGPVVYIPVVRGPGLAGLHQKLWPAVERHAAGALEYYRPERWVPHITLGHGDVSQQCLPELVRELAGRDFQWEIEIDNLAIISSCGSADGLHLRVPLSGT